MTSLGRIMCIVLLAVFLTGVVGCGGSKSSSSKPHTILVAPVQPISFTRVRRAVLELYRAHPDIQSFQVQDVTYTPKTRDKVLGVCHEGGPEKSASALESARVLACAPLIFFFYSYGRAASVPAATTVAQQLFWYAVLSNQRPHLAEPGLRTLLTGWGVR